MTGIAMSLLPRLVSVNTSFLVSSLDRLKQPQVLLGTSGAAVTLQRASQTASIKGSATTSAGRLVPDSPFHLIPGQSRDFPVCVNSSRNPSLVSSTAS